MDKLTNNAIANLCIRLGIKPEDRLDALHRREGEIIAKGYQSDDAWNVLNTSEKSICEKVADAANNGDLVEIGRQILEIMEAERANRAINQAIKDYEEEETKE